MCVCAFVSAFFLLPVRAGIIFVFTLIVNIYEGYWDLLRHISKVPYIFDRECKGYIGAFWGIPEVPYVFDRKYEGYWDFLRHIMPKSLLCLRDQTGYTPWVHRSSRQS